MLLALYYGASCALTLPTDGDQVAFGHRLVGDTGWVATLLHAVFFAWLAFAALRRTSGAAFGAIAYCVYLIGNIWIFSVGQGREMFSNTLSMVLVNALVTVILLSLCRVIMKRRDAFDR